VNKITKVLTISFFTNLFLSVLKIVFGIISNYASLIADGVHSLSDLITDVVSIIGNKLSLKPADDKHPFGHGIIEYITSILISLVIIFLGINLIINVFDHKNTIPNLFIGIICLFTIIIKFILSVYIIKKGKKYNNNILIASGSESKSDVISSLVVLISIIVMQFSNYVAVFKYADIIATIIVSLLIIKTGYLVLIDNLSKIIGEQIVDEEYLNEINEIILKQKEVLEIKNLYVLKNGPYYKLLSDVIMDKTITLSLAHKIIDTIENEIKEFDNNIKYVFIHMEPSE